jgi:hypothetical protein
MPKYFRTYLIQSVLLVLFLTACLVGLKNYGDMSLWWMPSLVVASIFVAVTINFSQMHRRNKIEGKYSFTIMKGKHHSKLWWWPRRGIINPKEDNLFLITINGPGLEYSHNDPKDQTAINKIFGVSYGLDHHLNSIRIGYNFDHLMNEFTLHAYWYRNGARISKPLCTLPITVFKELSFYLLIQRLTDGQVLVEVRERPQIRSRHHVIIETFNTHRVGWMLKPYFGGKKVAQDTINFEILRLST